MASSLSSSSPSSTFSQGKYDVFLSFRGEDTRANFTSHLYAALCQKQIQTFIDDDALKRGDETPPALLKAIEESKISLIIFSKDYASSRWCLDELVKILECKKIKGQMVIPVFYNVNPSDIRHLTGNYKEAFVKHEEYFKGKKEKVQRFRTALTEASYLSGWDSSVTRPDSKLVDEIVKDILEKLNVISPSTDCEGLVGLESRIEQVKSLLCTGLSDSRVVVGIWGMGGIGKTTIAEAIFNQISCQFEGRCFIQNVREESEKCGGLARLREQVISQVLQERNLSIGIPNMIPPFIKHRLQCKRVFIILDDVNDSEQLEFLIGGIDRFGPGSRVIITTRDRQVLRNFEVDNIYEVEGFEHHEALQLFCNFAFKQNSPPNDFWELSNKVVLYYAKGNPLALKVVASSLHKKNKQYWESAVKKLNKTPSPKILNILRISYDGLDHEEKNIFLDIACFFKGKDRDQVIRILDGCYHSALSGLSDLIDKALISISSDNTLQMHDLLQEMGWEIVRKVSFNEPGTHSRLWNPEDVCSVLKNNTGTDAIEGLFLDMSKIGEIHLSSETFKNMHNLRLLKFYGSYHPFGYFANKPKLYFNQGLEYLSDELRYLFWVGYPLKTLPLRFSPEKLFEISLPFSNIEKLWTGTKPAFKLKSIELYYSQHLIEIPDVSEAPNIEIINLAGCTNLVEVPSSIQYLNDLRILKLNGCKSLRNFPSNIHFKSLVTLDLASCINITEFPQISGNLRDLELGGTSIEEVPSSIACLTELCLLSLTRCSKLKSISTSICKLKSLQKLSLSMCAKLESFPEILEKMECLEFLWLNGATEIKELPSSIENLNGLQVLELADCKNLETIPSSIKKLTSLAILDLSGCTKLGKLPELSALCSLKDLDLSFCNLTKIPEEICCISSLDTLTLDGNNFESLPSRIKQLSRLTFLSLNNCSMLKSVPELPSCLRELNALHCKWL